jgi:riboflavin synthase
MFTGIVEEIGEVTTLDHNDSSGGTSLTITLPAGSVLLSDAHEGDSISVNGVCLTVVTFSPTHFTVGVAPETLRLTNLGSLTTSSKVNLERAVRADTRMGGHLVQGHVDCAARIVEVRPDGNALTMRFAPPAAGEIASATAGGVDVMRHVVRKGFIALDGTSLTVTAVDDAARWWEVMLIVYTQERVVLAAKKPGDLVNVEVDIMAKYAEKTVAGYLSGAGGPDAAPVLEKIVDRIVAEKLAARGL